MSDTAMLWTGRVLSGVVRVVHVGCINRTQTHLRRHCRVDVEGDLDWPAGYAFWIGLIELACVLLYLIPRTSILGAILMMAVLGGAIATQWRVGNPVFSHLLFGVYLGLFMWGGLWFRDPAFRAVFPFRAD